MYTIKINQVRILTTPVENTQHPDRFETESKWCWLQPTFKNSNKNINRFVANGHCSFKSILFVFKLIKKSIYQDSSPHDKTITEKSRKIMRSYM